MPSNSKAALGLPAQEYGTINAVLRSCVSCFEACDGGPAQSFVRGPLIQNLLYDEMYKLQSGGKDVEFAKVQPTIWSTVAFHLPDSGYYKGRLATKEENGQQTSYQSFFSTSGGGDIGASTEGSPPFDWRPASRGDKYVWTMSTTLSDTDFEMDCGVGYVIQRFWKLKVQVRYSCVRLASLGSCAEQTSVQQIIGNTAARIDMNCGDDRSIQAIFGEYDAAGKWARFRFRCCQIASNPVLFLRSPFGWTAQTSAITAVQGIYAPVAIDDFGRPLNPRPFLH